MAYNTGNPVGSTDPRDLYDNAPIFDKFTNGAEPFYPNRFGEQGLSLSGMRQDFENSQDGRQAAFDQFLEASSFVWIGDYGAGLTFTSRSQYMVRDGQAYRLATTTTLPYTTTGNWELEQTKFSLVNSDDILRQDLSNTTDPAKGAAILGRGAVSVTSMYALCQLGTYRADLIYSTFAWNNSAVVAKLRGGGNYIYVPTIPKSQHNGGYIISPTVPISTEPSSTPAFLAGTGETDPTGFGCLVLLTTGDIWAESFGLFDDPGYSWNCKSFQAAINWGDVKSPDVSPGAIRFTDGEYRTTDPVIIWRPNGETGRVVSFRGAGRYNSAIIKTTNNTAGAQYGSFNLDAAVIEIPKDGDDLQIGGANIGGFILRKLANDRTGYGFYAGRSYFGKRSDMFIAGFNQGFSTPGCWMQELNSIWAFGCNTSFTLSGTSNSGGNLYSSGAYEIGFDLSGLTYSRLDTACDGTGSQGTTPKIAYKLSGSHGLNLTCGVEKTVGVEFDIRNCSAINIVGSSYSTGVSAVPVRKVVIVNSRVNFSFDWGLSLNNLTADQKALYPFLYSADIQSQYDFEGCNFGSTDPRMPEVLDGRAVAVIQTAPYRNTDGVVHHNINLSSTVFKKAVDVSGSTRIKFVGGLCSDGTADISFEPTVPLGYAVSAISTTEGAPTNIGDLYIAGSVSAGKLVGYVSGGWLYVRGPSGQQRNCSLHFITAPMRPT